MADCRKLGILVHGCFMVGFPGETRETLQKTLDLAISLDPDSAQFYPVMPYPGTGAYKWAEENGFLATTDFAEWLNPDGGHRCVLNLPGLSAKDLEDFCEHAVRRFHFRPRYMLRKGVQALTNPQEGIRSVNAFKNFLGSLVRGEKAVAAPVLPTQTVVNELWGSRMRVPRGRMEEVLWKVAEALNESPTGDVSSAAEGRVTELLTSLICEAIRLGQFSGRLSTNGQPDQQRDTR